MTASSVVVPTAALAAAELALDPSTGDLLFPIQILRGPLAIAQRIRSRFRFFLGEWFLDTRQGVPYYQSILVKNPNIPIISAIFSQVLVKTPGVSSVMFLKILPVDRAARKSRVDFQAKLADGSVLSSSNLDPFIITAGQ